MIAASMLRQQVAAWKEKWEKANKSLRSARRALADREREAVSLRDHIQRLDDEVQERYRAFRKCVPVDVTNHYDKHTTVRHYHLRFRFPDLRFSAPEELLRQDAHPHTVRRRIKTELVAAFSEDIDRQLLHMIVEESRG